MDGAAAAAAVVAGTVGLLLRTARAHGRTPSPSELKDAIVEGCSSPGILSPQIAVDRYLQRVQGGPAS